MHDDAVGSSDTHELTTGDPQLHLPAPSIWPAACALGVTLVMFAVVTSVWFGIVGLVLMATAIARWVGEVMGDDT